MQDIEHSVLGKRFASFGRLCDISYKRLEKSSLIATGFPYSGGVVNDYIFSGFQRVK